MKEEELLKYEKPRLIELGTENGQGVPDCYPGSSADTNCGDGGLATATCDPSGGFFAVAPPACETEGLSP